MSAGDDVNIELEFAESAPEELQELARQYWAFTGVDDSTGDVLWASKTTSLYYAPWAGAAHIAAAAGALATAPGYQCEKCGGPLTLGSRQSLSDARRGRRAACRQCHSSLEARVVEVLSPNGLVRRERQAQQRADRAKAQAEQAEAAARTREREKAIATARAEVISSQFGIDESDIDVEWVDVTRRVAALAIIHALENPDGLIYPVNYSNGSIGPTFETSKAAVEGAWSAGILRIHPSTLASAFGWTDEDPPTLGDTWSPQQARFYVSGNGTLTQRLADTADALRVSLRLSELTSVERNELRRLCSALIEGEAIRYFRQYLDEHNLPDPADHHMESLRAHVHRGADTFCLGHLYRMMWSSVRDGSSAHERSRGMSRESATTHAVNRFARWVERATDTPSILNEPFDARHDLPLSCLTDLAFRVILGVNPMTVLPEQVDNLLTGPSEQEALDECDLAILERSELLEMLRVTRGRWDQDDFRRALAELTEWSSDPCAPGCAHSLLASVASDAAHLYDRIEARTGEHVAQIVAEATMLSNTRRACRPGDLLLQQISVHLGVVDDGRNDH